MLNIEYFYSAHSAYAYFGSARLKAIAGAAGRHIEHRPVHLDRVLEGAGSTGFRERSLAFRNYFFNREMERWCEYRGIKHLGRRPTWHHHSPHLANRVLIAALAEGRNVDQLSHRMLESHWGEDSDLADVPTLVALCGEAGFDGEALVVAADSPSSRETYDANTDEAVARSVFGSPTYFVDGDMFYGQDRLELVERALEKPFAKTWPKLTA